MVVNGFELPVAFVKLCEATRRGEAPVEWELKENVDAYGRPWEVVDLHINCDPREIQSDTDWLSNAFLHEERFQQDSVDADQAGFIADFPGMANLVWFGRGSDGLPYAFDFGTDAKEPSVIHWKGYWRRVAPSFAAFIGLFGDALAEDAEDEDEEDDDEDEAEERQRPERSLRSDLAAWVRQYVFAIPAERRPAYFTQLAKGYAKLSPQDRHEVEAEVREELESEGINDEDRRRLDEVWARLRATLPS
jgi:hypothetical protein